MKKIILILLLLSSIMVKAQVVNFYYSYNQVTCNPNDRVIIDDSSIDLSAYRSNVISRVSFKQDGLRFFSSVDGSYIKSFDMSNSYVITTSSYSQSFYLGTGVYFGLYVQTIGDYFYIIDVVNKRVRKYSTNGYNWLLTSVLFVSSYDIPSGDPTTIQFSDDGKFMYLGGNAQNKIDQYILSTPWDITTSSYLQQITLEYYVSSFVFMQNGSKALIGNQQNGNIREYILTIPWNITTAVGCRLYTNPSLNGSYGLTTSSDGQYIFYMDSSTGTPAILRKYIY